MEHLLFNVAHHPFVIAAPQTGAVFAHIPSYRPFIVEGPIPEHPLFTLTLTTEEVTTEIPFYTSFEWDDADCKVYRSKGNYAFEVIPRGDKEHFLMTCDDRFSNAMLSLRTESPSYSFILNNFIMMLYAFASAEYDTLLMHASVIRYQGKGYLFQGKSGTGKSTHSSLWLRHIPGTELLNDDNPVIRISQMGGGYEVHVFGSPWSGKTPCYRNEEASIGAFVRLSQAPDNCIIRQGIAQSFASLLPSCSSMKWDKRIHEAICETVGKLVTTVAIYHLSCRPNKEAVLLCKNTVVS